MRSSVVRLFSQEVLVCLTMTAMPRLENQADNGSVSTTGWSLLVRTHSVGGVHAGLNIQFPCFLLHQVLVDIFKEVSENWAYFKFLGNPPEM